MGRSGGGGGGAGRVGTGGSRTGPKLVEGGSGARDVDEATRSLAIGKSTPPVETC